MSPRLSPPHLPFPFPFLPSLPLLDTNPRIHKRRHHPTHEQRPHRFPLARPQQRQHRDPRPQVPRSCKPHERQARRRARPDRDPERAAEPGRVDEAVDAPAETDEADCGREGREHSREGVRDRGGC